MWLAFWPFRPTSIIKKVKLNKNKNVNNICMKT